MCSGRKRVRPAPRRKIGLSRRVETFDPASGGSGADRAARPPSHKRGAAVLLRDVGSLIEAARQHAARAVNATLVGLYWGIGERVGREILGGRRADYGEQIVSTLSGQLAKHYGRGFGRPALFHMIRFAELFPDFRIVQTLSAQLGWSHFVEILYVKDPLAREFYAEMCRIERWSVRTLRAKIGGLLFERTAISRRPAKSARAEIKALRDEDRMTPDLVFRDPYVLDFLRLEGAYAEKDVESAILRDLESFLLEFGAGFTFVARQKRITVDGDDHYLDPRGRVRHRPAAAEGARAQAARGHRSGAAADRR